MVVADHEVRSPKGKERGHILAAFLIKAFLPTSSHQFFLGLPILIIFFEEVHVLWSNVHIPEDRFPCPSWCSPYCDGCHNRPLSEQKEQVLPFMYIASVAVTVSHLICTENLYAKQTGQYVKCSALNRKEKNSFQSSGFVL